MKRLLLLLALALTAKGAMLAPGIYSLKNVGFRTCNMESVYLGYNNKTCPTSPFSRTASQGSTNLWKSWELTITGYHTSGYPIGVFSTSIAPEKSIKCPGNLSPFQPAFCGKPDVVINGAMAEWRLVGPVPGYTNPTYRLAANMKPAGCARYLAASTNCSNTAVQMVVQAKKPVTLWELTPLQLGTKAPGPARINTVVRGTGAARTVVNITFSSPEVVGCGPITRYILTARALAGGAMVQTTVKGAATAAQLTGLTAHVRYNFTIAAVNPCGTGPLTWYVETLATSDAVAAAGHQSVCAVKADSKMTCIEGANNGFGELAIPTKWKQGNDVVQLVSNFRFTAALARNGSLGLWGANIESGCNPTSTDTDCLPEGFDEGVCYIHGWSENLCISKWNGDMTCIGENIDDTITFSSLPNYSRFGFTKGTGSYDGFLSGVKLAKVGDQIGCVVFYSGFLRCWGDGSAFQTGSASRPLPISFFRDIIDVGVTADGVCALKYNGDLACSSQESASGPGFMDHRKTLPIPDGFDRGIGAIDCAQFSCCAWKSDGDFTCWGVSRADGSQPDAAEETYSYGLGTIPNFIAGIGKYTWRTFDGYAYNESPPEGRKLLLNYSGNRKLRNLVSEPGASIRWPVMTEVVSFSMGAYTTCVLRRDASLQSWAYYSQSVGNVGWDSYQVQLTLTGYDYLF